MKSQLLLLISSLICIVFISCKEAESVEPKFDYLQFETADTAYLFNVEYDDIWNSYVWNPDFNRDQLGIVFTNKSQNKIGSLFIIGSRLLAKEFPLTLNMDVNIAEFGRASISVVHNLIPIDTVFGANDSVNYFGHSMKTLILIVDSFEDEVIRGTFSGALETRTGKLLPVRNGKFKVKIKMR